MKVDERNKLAEALAARRKMLLDLECEALETDLKRRKTEAVVRAEKDALLAQKEEMAFRLEILRREVLADTYTEEKEAALKVIAKELDK